MGRVSNLSLRSLALALLVAGLCVSLTAPLFAQGSAEDTYNKKCAVCHAKDGSGNTAKGKNLHVKDVHALKDSEAAMIKVVTEGKGEMDSYKDQLSADQIKAVVEYYRSLAK